MEWVTATAAYYLGLLFFDHNKCTSFRDTLIENGVKDLKSSYANITGHVPDVLCELIACNPDMRRVDLATILACIRYNYLAIKKRPVHVVQITNLMSELVGELCRESRRSTFLQTMNFLVKEGMEERVACATSYRMHHRPTRTDPVRCVEIQTSDIHAHHTLPNSYLAVDSDGGLWVVDIVRGTYPISTPTRIPTGWLCRTTPDGNTFMAGDDTQCVGLVLNDSLDACIQSPIVLPTYPSGARSVENRWVVWGSARRPHAVQWRDGDLTLCASEEAKMHVLSHPHMDAAGNRVTLNGEVVCCVSPDQTISCLFGNCRDVDVITGANDLWRVDIVNNKAWCVGLETVPIVNIAPLVGWD